MTRLELDHDWVLVMYPIRSSFRNPAIHCGLTKQVSPQRIIGWGWDADDYQSGEREARQKIKQGWR